MYNFQFQIGTVPIPKSISKERIYNNIKIFDFELTANEVALMETFNTGERLEDFAEASDGKYYPFNINF